MSLLLEPYTLRQLTFLNRIAVSPMCQYSSVDGLANDWHLVHLGSRAVGGAGLIFTEATAVTADGRITAQDLGLWNDQQIEPLQRITRFIRAQGAVAGIQLAHAGRKASTWRPWLGKQGSVRVEEGGWVPVGPSPIAFDPRHTVPTQLDERQIQDVIQAFADAAKRALEAGFSVVEVHAAHGYLLHQFLSPLSNQRRDQYGGSFENRIRLVLQVTEAVREVWPQELPLFVRVSATDWVEDGWNPDETVELARRLKALGVDLIDVSSGGTSANAEIPVGPGYQTRFAESIRKASGIATGTVGMITEPAQAEHILRTGQADLILLARELLRDPYWPLHADDDLGGKQATWPAQYQRATHRDQPIHESDLRE
ncbi:MULTISPECIES: NADH:flavin oxidoreductase/NADH oxidase [Pseudomonas]|jgi:2,4-dienoyl-CoA reductase-like NADH-dependent reductase (Old Yellow Enzyme family)|uniref:NADH:flavin oxidoreductase/NADH oxidase n=1 Tax=Pseudomonas lundensis TaxID=86185 RepID=A0AAP7ZY77_9PSED|nr:MULTISPECIES: NADH:flavin oxidoreductase/NADH oxidase [Pseudomonas]KMM89448.1 oxidoreductase [Pseudomonas lundensis]MBM1182501.1 NADH:flavin oxidoreductase/NADH oxidase [Pseudomonas lundensis]MBM1188229.1 NADH:flavin oxidoreductase/NADH oxidase [Pseudomonas lundensis]MBS5839059.1 NADH:flavin oxidoreductase/NADH oxidase [Pseudomonas sp.]MCT8952035.1 NADH:flavin oxidoreductase/NADH oxidase [Pseudomonas lundensis]